MVEIEAVGTVPVFWVRFRSALQALITGGERSSLSHMDCSYVATALMPQPVLAIQHAALCTRSTLYALCVVFIDICLKINF